jgi:uncharacterized protein (DUF488 family)
VEVAAVFTIGHGNRGFEEFAGLLAANSIECLVDVRAFPGSRRHPHFGRDALEQSLSAAGVQYVWEGEALGGRRRANRDSAHHALRNESFRAYADHMETDVFRAGVDRLKASAKDARIAIMCAERLPWQCHRYMISDYLVAFGTSVYHVIDGSAPRAHSVRPEARPDGARLIYDIGSQPPLALGRD